MLLSTPLTMPERQIIHRRLEELRPGLAPAKPSQIKQAVMEMFVAFTAGRGQDESETAIVVAKYVEVLSGLPYFAIKRAAQRFEGGHVTADDIGEKKPPSKAFPPSAPQLRMVAEAIVRPHWDEATVGDMLLRAKVDSNQPLSDEEKAKRKAYVERVMKEINAAAAAANMKDATEQAERERMKSETTARRHEEMLLAEYRQQGLEPVFCDADKTIIQSLTGLLRRGWTIQQVDGENVLVQPGHAVRK